MVCGPSERGVVRGGGKDQSGVVLSRGVEVGVVVEGRRVRKLEGAASRAELGTAWSKRERRYWNTHHSNHYNTYFDSLAKLKDGCSVTSYKLSGRREFKGLMKNKQVGQGIKF